MRKLQETVLLGYCDISAAGCRALVGCNGDLEAMNLGKTRIHNDVPQSQIRSDSDVPFVGHVDHGKEKVSAVAISAQISSGTASCFMNDIFDEFISSECKEIVIVAAIPIKLKSVPEDEVFQICVNCDKVDDVKCLPDDFIVKDMIINMAIQFARVEQMPLRCFVTQGYKIGSGCPNLRDGSLQSIKNLQSVLHLLYKLDFSKEKTQSLAYNGKASESQLQNIMFL